MNEVEKAGLTSILNGLKTEDLMSLANTSTGRLVKTQTKSGEIRVTL